MASHPRRFLVQIVAAVACVAATGHVGHAADFNLTIDNAPPIARQMTLTADEFRGLLPDRLKPYVTYAPANLAQTERSLGRKDGQFFIWGKWERKGNRNTGPLDFQYRVATKGPTNNPSICNTVTALQAVPPSKDQPEGTLHWTVPARRIDIEVRCSVNAYNASPENIQKFRGQLAKSAAEGKGNDTYLKPRHIPDLGFGLDRNDMFIALEPKPGSNGGCAANVYLADTRKALFVEVRVNCGYRAISPKQTITLAKNAAALMANKVFGTNAKLERSPVEAGILDVYLASRLGRTPEEDVHENKFKLGDTVYLAVVYRPTEPGMRVRINASMRPAVDALAASEIRAPLVKPELARSKGHHPKPLQANMSYHVIEAWMTGDGRVDEANSYNSDVLDAALSTKPFSGDTQVFYVSMTTGNLDNLEKFYLGIGRWDVAVSMSEYRGKDTAFESRYDKDSQEVSTEKVQLFMADNPPVALRYLTELPKKP